MMVQEKYLILGSNSFSGATFADFLAADGHDVVATSRSDEPHQAFLPYKWQKRPGRVRFKRIDLNHDLDGLKVLLASERPTHIVNFAAQSMFGGGVDMRLRTYFANYKFPVVFTRAANVYGPGQQLYRIVPRTIVAAMGGQKLRLDGGGKSVRVFIHMTDVSDATLKIARTGTLGDTYHISGYELVSIRTLVEMILARLGKPFDDCVEIAPERPGKDTAYMLDSIKLRTELGWRGRGY